eukprot:2311122-Rhodomonas_salina.1
MDGSYGQRACQGVVLPTAALRPSLVASRTLALLLSCLPLPPVGSLMLLPLHSSVGRGLLNL